MLNFSPDARRMYIGTYTSGLTVVGLDANFDRTGTRPFARLSGNHADGLGVDICGNLYVPMFGDSFLLYRVSPGGDAQVYYDFEGSLAFGHGLAWGSGIGDWKETALYLPQPFNGDRVLEIDIGVPSRAWDGVATGR